MEAVVEKASEERCQDPDLLTAAIVHGHMYTAYRIPHTAKALLASRPGQPPCHWKALAGQIQPLAGK